MNRVVQRIAAKAPAIPRKKRVAAYARVSSAKDSMLHSLSAQVSYYSDMIQKHRGWEYAGVYTDEALTGTKDNRLEFQHLLSDCRTGMIDMVIVKSISRFARNTVTLLETVRELKMLNIDVFFERENIHSISGDGELMLTILASFAQEESRSVSENCKWRIRKQYEIGKPANWNFMYGYRIQQGSIEIEPIEAEVVKAVFQAYITGVGSTEIARDLREKAVPSTRNGVWTPKRVVELLKNEKYAGNALLQKKYVADHLSKVEKMNHGKLPMYYAEQTHPPIIPLHTYQLAQDIMERNRLQNGIERAAEQYSCFTGMIVCGQCGKNYRRKASKTEVSWNCATYLTLGKAYCHTKQIPEDILLLTSASVLGLHIFDEKTFKANIKEIRIPSFNHMLFIFHNGKTDERIWQDKSRRNSWNESMRKQAAEHTRRRYQK